MTIQTSELIFQNPGGYEISWSILQDFENGLDTLDPLANKIPCRVLGYGEISTAFEILVDGMRGYAYKRMSCFRRPDELKLYIDTYLTYSHILEGQVGLHLPPYGYAAFPNKDGRPVVYIIQKRLNPESIGNRALHSLTPPQITSLFCCVLQELHKVWIFNRTGSDCQVSIDGQISNWAIVDFDPENSRIDRGTSLLYIDTSTPLFRQNGKEQVNVEIFLRSAPPFLVWILRMLFVKDVATRYYDPRKVIIDLIANFYKEQRPELIPDLIGAANVYIEGEGANLGLAEITQKEVRDYYREDAIIWRLYLGMRRFDRFIRKKILHREYPYVLPGQIKR